MLQEQIDAFQKYHETEANKLAILLDIAATFDGVEAQQFLLSQLYKSYVNMFNTYKAYGDVLQQLSPQPVAQDAQPSVAPHTDLQGKQSSIKNKRYSYVDDEDDEDDDDDNSTKKLSKDLESEDRIRKAMLDKDYQKHLDEKLKGAPKPKPVDTDDDDDAATDNYDVNERINMLKARIKRANKEE
jgi:hypothetical protein